MKINDISERIIIKYFEGKATQQESRLLSDWLDQNKNNRQIFAALKKAYIETEANAMHDSSAINDAYKKFLEHINNYEMLKAADRKKKITSLRNYMLRYAAIFIVIVSVGIGSYFLGFNLSPGADNNFCEVNVPYGSRSKVVLSDGSKIWLNAGSKIKYNKHFDKTSRKVFLEGEAYFDVKKTKHPFIVHTSHIDIHVLGTTFNVKSYPDEDNIVTTLVKGNIRIESKKSDNPVYLKPNEKLTFHKHDAKTQVSYYKKESESEPNRQKTSANVTVPNTTDQGIHIKRNVNIDEYTSWKDGTLIFNKEPLESLARKLERKYDITFSFENEELKNYSYSGTLRDFPLEQVLKALELTSPVIYAINEKTVKLYFNSNTKQLN
ncbi:MAG: FecR family protein [Bacteroidales bacterium]|nr:MAG: FecR family protein [Bacteroidales bacterium]